MIKEDTVHIPEIKDNVEQLQEDIAELRAQLLQSGAVQPSHSLTLQRFLDSSTTYAESVVQDDDLRNDDWSPKKSMEEDMNNTSETSSVAQPQVESMKQNAIVQPEIRVPEEDKGQAIDTIQAPDPDVLQAPHFKKLVTAGPRADAFSNEKAQGSQARDKNDSSHDSDEEQSRRLRSQMSMFQSELAEVDSKKRQQDRDALLAIAHRNVGAQISKLDEKVYQETGKASPAQMEKWERAARERAQRDSDERMQNTGEVHIGRGKYIDQSELDTIAKARLQPTLDDIADKAEKQQARSTTQLYGGGTGEASSFSPTANYGGGVGEVSSLSTAKGSVSGHEDLKLSNDALITPTSQIRPSRSYDIVPSESSTATLAPPKSQIRPSQSHNTSRSESTLAELNMIRQSLLAVGNKSSPSLFSPEESGPAPARDTARSAVALSHDMRRPVTTRERKAARELRVFAEGFPRTLSVSPAASLETSMVATERNPAAATELLGALFQKQNNSYNHIKAVTVRQIQSLLDQGADINNSGVKDNDKRPLYQAACYGTAELVRYLLAHGADITLGINPLRNACLYQKGENALEVAKVLVEYGAEVRNDVRPLISAVQHGGPFKLVKFLLEQGADPNEKSWVLNTGVGVIFRPMRGGNALDAAKGRSAYTEQEKQEKQAIIELVKWAQKRARQDRR